MPLRTFYDKLEIFSTLLLNITDLSPKNCEQLNAGNCIKSLILIFAKEKLASSLVNSHLVYVKRTILKLIGSRP